MPAKRPPAPRSRETNATEPQFGRGVHHGTKPIRHRTNHRRRSRLQRVTFFGSARRDFRQSLPKNLGPRWRATAALSQSDAIECVARYSTFWSAISVSASLRTYCRLPRRLALGSGWKRIPPPYTFKWRMPDGLVGGHGGN